MRLQRYNKFAIYANILRKNAQGLAHSENLYYLCAEIVYETMVKHIILWKLRSELSAAEKQAACAAIKAGLEGLQGQVPGLLDIHVQTSGRLDSSNADIMLDCTLESAEALKGYAVHPAHVAVANGVVRPVTEVRTCLDYEI